MFLSYNYYRFIIWLTGNKHGDTSAQMLTLTTAEEEQRNKKLS